MSAQNDCAIHHLCLPTVTPATTSWGTIHWDGQIESKVGQPATVAQSFFDTDTVSRQSDCLVSSNTGARVNCYPVCRQPLIRLLLTYHCIIALLSIYITTLSSCRPVSAVQTQALHQHQTTQASLKQST